MRKLFCMMALAGSFLFSPAPGRFSPDGSGEPYYPHDVTRVITTTIAITITAPIGLIITGTVKTCWRSDSEPGRKFSHTVGSIR